MIRYAHIATFAILAIFASAIADGCYVAPYIGTSSDAVTFPGLPATTECQAYSDCMCATTGPCTSLCADNLCVWLDGNANTDCKVCGATLCNDMLVACTNSGPPDPPFSCALYFPDAPVCDAGYVTPPQCDQATTSGCYSDGDLVCADPLVWTKCCLVDDSGLGDYCASVSP